MRMNQIKTKIYYFISTGEVLLHVINIASTSKKEDYNNNVQLQEKDISDIDYIEVENDTLNNTFNNVKSYKVNPKTKKLETIYFTQEELGNIQKEQEKERSILDRINYISEYANLDNNSIDILEDAIIEYETSLITSRVKER